MDKQLKEALAQPATTVPLAGKALGLSRNAAYEAAQRGDIPTLKIGGRIIVPTAKLRAMLGMDAATVAAEPATVGEGV